MKRHKDTKKTFSVWPTPAFDVDAMMDNPHAPGMRDPDRPQLPTYGRIEVTNQYSVAQLPFHSQHLLDDYSNDRLEQQQSRFAMQHSLTDEDVRVITLFSSIVGFPTCAACPNAKYTAGKLTNNTFAVLNRKDIKWYVQGGSTVRIRCPTFGMNYMTSTVNDDLSYTGTERKYYHARRVTVKVDGIQFPVLTVSDGRRFLVRILGDQLSVVRIYGYSGDFLEYVESEDTYYGHGSGRVYFDDKPHKYVNIYDLELKPQSEGIVIDYELLSAKVVRRPTLDLKVDGGTACDADSNIILTNRSLNNLTSGIYEIDVQDMGSPVVVRPRHDKVRANDPSVVICLTEAISLDDVPIKPPYNTPVLVNLAAPSSLSRKNIGLKSGCSPITPVVHTTLYSRSSYKEFTKLVKSCTHNGFLSSTQLCRKMRKLGCSFDYECLRRYLGWCGFYPTRDGWRYARYQIPVMFTCSRMYDAARPCKCIEKLKFANTSLHATLKGSDG